MRLVRVLFVVGCVQGCGAPSAPDAGTCESPLEWGHGGALMLPGTNCLRCHTTGGRASPFTAAGTVFTSPVCASPATQAVVTLTDAQHKSVSLPVNELGNFFTTEPLMLPFRVVVESEGRSVEMEASAAGDCGYCHQPDGRAGQLTAP